MASSIEKKIQTYAAFNCEACREVFSTNKKITDNFFAGKLGPPCETTYQICYIANNFLKILAKNVRYTYDELFNDICNQINIESAYANTNFDRHETHREYFIKVIIEEYVRKEANSIARAVTRKEKGSLIRNLLVKQIHRSGQWWAIHLFDRILLFFCTYNRSYIFFSFYCILNELDNSINMKIICSLKILKSEVVRLNYVESAEDISSFIMIKICMCIRLNDYFCSYCWSNV